MITDRAVSDVVDELRAQVDSWSGIEWVAGRLTEDALVAVVRRDGEDGLEGHRVPTASGALEDPALRTALVLDAVLDLVQADGPAVPLPQPWAAGLGVDEGSVRWRGEAVAQSAHESLSLLHSSVQGCGGMPL